MIVTYFRSSSYNNWDYCEMQYYINYVLGWKSDPNKKAEMGTVVHKVMEILACIKKEMQEANKGYIIDKDIGSVNYNEVDLFKPVILTDKQVDKFNKGVINKQTYMWDVSIPYKTKRIGKEFVDNLIERAYKYYSEKSIHNWIGTDKRDCRNWTWTILDYNDGEFDPRFNEIFEVEPYFNYEIEEDWAKYKYVLDNGEEIDGYLSLMGTVDQISIIDENTLHIQDWKTGQRLNWATGERKTYEYLMNDPQLMLYSYVIKKVYPQYKNIVVSIFYARDGGPFTLSFDNDDIVVNKIRQRFQNIKNNEKPKMRNLRQSDFRCNILCHYYKNNFDGSNNNMCKEIHNSIKNEGFDYTSVVFKNPDHHPDKYDAPGA